MHFIRVFYYIYYILYVDGNMTKCTRGWRLVKDVTARALTHRKNTREKQEPRAVAELKKEEYRRKMC